jgi:hypothetical protein
LIKPAAEAAGGADPPAAENLLYYFSINSLNFPSPSLISAGSMPE